MFEKTQAYINASTQRFMVQDFHLIVKSVVDTQKGLA